MKKQDLKTGMLVQSREGDVYMVINNITKVWRNLRIVMQTHALTKMRTAKLKVSSVT